MKTSSALLVSLALVVASALYSLVLYASLPPVVPVHWNIHGQVDGYGARLTVCVLMPLVMLGLLAVLMVLPALSPQNFKLESFRSTYNLIAVIVVGLFAFIHVVSLQAALHPSCDSGRIVVAGIFLFIAALGNLLGKVRRNFWVGVRTPWTLASDTVWIATHRLAARLMVASGVIGGFGALVGVPLWLCFTFLMAGILWPAVYSFIYYRRLEQTGAL